MITRWGVQIFSGWLIAPACQNGIRSGQDLNFPEDSFAFTSSLQIAQTSNMPARDPLISPRRNLPSAGTTLPMPGSDTSPSAPPPPLTAIMPPQASAPQIRPLNGPGASSYLPGTSNTYYAFDDSEDDVNSMQDDDHRDRSYHRRGSAGMRTPPPVASGSQWLVASYHNSPKRPSMQRRGSASTFRSDVFSDTADVIRARTALLADMPYRRSSPSTHNIPLSAATQTSFYTADDGAGGERFYPATYVPPPSAKFNSSSSVTNVVGADVILPPSVDAAASTAAPIVSSAPTSLFHSHTHSHTHHPSAAATAALAPLETVIERPSPTSSSPSSSTSNSPRNASPSGLSRMFAREKSKSRSNSPAAPPRPTTNQDQDVESGVPKVLVRRATGEAEEGEESSGSATPTATEDAERARSDGVLLDMQNAHNEEQAATETSRLLPSNSALPTSYGGPAQSSVKSYVAATRGNIVDRISSASKALAKRSTYSSIGKEAVSSIPAVILGMLLNILDGVSYGFIMFPTGTLFAGFGGIGVSMFFVTTIIAQLVYSLGGSTFAGANGSMMIEVVPFFHMIANGIVEVVGEDDVETVVATTMVAFAFSSIITDFRKTSFPALIATMPTQLALLFFNILHPPLNVPALAVSLNVDEVDTNRELVAHGISNVLAGCLGTVPNYLVYVNTLMFYRVGGGSRISGLLLAAATFVLLIIGTAPIGYIPIMLVGALIFVLGIDLIKEAVWDTRHRTSTSEYITIIAIMVAMSLWDFVIGVLFGIVLACIFFVVQNSRRRSIRAIYTGASSMSTVRRPSAHREYLREVGKQTVIMRLQGFLFFGTITNVEETIRKLLDQAAWERHPIRFLIIDLALVGGLDMSSAEAFARVHRLLTAKSVTLIFCGVSADSTIAHALQAVDLWTDHEDGVEAFEDLNQALEWTENAYLRAWFSVTYQQKVERADKPIEFPGKRQNSPIRLTESFQNSPRRNQLHDAGTRIMPPELAPNPQSPDTEPVNTLLKAFSSYATDLDESFYSQLVPYLKQVVVPGGHVLFSQDEESDGLYLIEHGVMRAVYRFKSKKAWSAELWPENYLRSQKHRGTLL
ncbi:hypothetical protein M407DRAFT_215409 [Tulasnella calospora MUT 4182]|uniref:STAS domain-containing protein n=1 Tax=Tulasnella calospora MUT 4182 TaxID=1051891 RepID=A0A0C3LNZ8_9AGAM|nr:hypothetical protein M407DRAFT_215409 [Tulasnella calospora MUT 4182]